MRTKFRNFKLSNSNVEKLNMINSIIKEYQQEGYKLTLRQLYYQLVSRDIIPNKQSEYSKLSKLLKEGRMSGVVDWEAIEDRLRVPFIPYSNTSPTQAIEDAIDQYRLNRQRNQQVYLEVWVEKDALSGVLRRITSKYHINLLVNRGYGSVTAIHDAYTRFSNQIRKGNKVKILYLGDHDPSGIDMIRDIKERIMEMLMQLDGISLLENKYGEVFHRNEEFQNWNEEKYDDDDFFYDEEVRVLEESGEYVWRYDKAYIKDSFNVEAIALTTEQIKTYNPPPNPAKVTDPRAKDYIKKFGRVSWEVDALNPKTLNQILTNSIENNIDLDLFYSIIDKEKKDKQQLRELSEKL
jgi:hypothetical protein